jgi:plastocyanin
MTPSKSTSALVLAGVVAVSALTGCSSSTQPSGSSSSKESPSTSSSASRSTSPPGSASGSASPSTGSGSTASGSTTSATITIKNFKYTGATSVPARAQVTVKNDDTEAHTVTSDTSGAFDVKIDPGESVTFVAPAKTGSFPYHCTYHGNMHGTLKVS